MITLIISEVHMTGTVRKGYHLGSVLSVEVLAQLPELYAYIERGVDGSSNDYRRIERANSLHFTVWLHHLNMYTSHGSNCELSMNAKDHELSHSLGYYLAMGTTGLSYKEVRDFCIRESKYENQHNLEGLSTSAL